MDSIDLNDEYIDKTVENILAGETLHNQRLNYALKTMVYAYIAGHCLKGVEVNLKLLKESKED